MIFLDQISAILLVVVILLLIPSELLLRFIKSKRKFKNNVRNKIKNTIRRKDS
jgi:inner membrane protein involved in colicin E2 resistance